MDFTSSQLAYLEYGYIKNRFKKPSAMSAETILGRFSATGMLIGEFPVLLEKILMIRKVITTTIWMKLANIIVENYSQTMTLSIMGKIVAPKRSLIWS